MAGVDQDPAAAIDARLSAVARVEAEFGHHLWNEDFEKAAQALHRGRDQLFAVSNGLGGWYLLWLGYLHDLLNAPEEAISLYRQARQAEKSLPQVPAPPAAATPAVHPDGDQVREVANVLRGRRDVLAAFDRETAAMMQASSSVGQNEEAIRALGAFLGLDSSRPDSTVGTGPDVLWCLEGKPAWALELKTEMKNETGYSKKYVAQVGDHVQWVRANKTVSEVIPALVGPLLPAEARANPVDGLLVMELPALCTLRGQVRTALETLAAYRLPLLLEGEVKRVFGDMGLLWSALSRRPLGTPIKDIGRGTVGKT